MQQALPGGGGGGGGGVNEAAVIMTLAHRGFILEEDSTNLLLFKSLKSHRDTAKVKVRIPLAPTDLLVPLHVKNLCFVFGFLKFVCKCSCSWVVDESQRRLG